MNKTFALLLIGAVFLFGCVSYGSQPAPDAHGSPAQVVAAAQNGSTAANQAGSQMPQSGQPTVSQQPSASPEPQPSSPAASVKEFNLTAQQWHFTPDSISVKRGDHVKLHIRSLDVTHGFSIVEFNVNTQITAMQTTDVEFTPDRTGTFNFFCSVFCGSGHGGMKGTLVVTD